MRRVLRVGKWTIRVVFGIIAIAVLTLWFGTRTNRGQMWAIGMIVERVEGRIDGTLTVAGVSSPDLMGGATLQGVTVRGDDGRPVLQADSARFDFSLFSLLGPDLEFDAITLWGGDARIERLEEGQRTNLQRLLRTAQGEGEGEASGTGAPEVEEAEGGTDAGDEGRRVSVGRVNWLGGGLEIALPAGGAEPDSDARFEELADGTRLRVTVLDEVAVRGIDLVLSGRRAEEPVVRLETAAAALHLAEEPFRVVDLSGPVLWAGREVALQATSFALESTSGQGMVAYGPPDGPDGAGERVLSVEVDLERFDLADLEPLSGELLDVSGTARIDAVIDDGLSSLVFRDADVEWEGGTAAGDGSVRFPRGEPVFGRTSLVVARVPLGRLAELSDQTLPVDGWIDGTLGLSGPLEDLDVDGHLTLNSPALGGVVTADFEGGLDAVEPYAVSGMRLDLDPFRFELIGEFQPAFKLQGPGRIGLRGGGSLDGGFTVDYDVTHRPPAYPTSLLTGSATVRPTDDGGLDLTLRNLRAAPLSLGAIRAAYPSVPFQGRVDGELDGRGELSSFEFATRLQTTGGTLELQGTTDLRDPAATYAATGSVEDFVLSNLLVDLPDSTVVTGAFDLAGTGFSPEDVVGVLAVSVDSAEVAGIEFGPSAMNARAEAGMLRLDSVSILSELGSVVGQGTLALSETAPPGEVVLDFVADSLGVLQSIVHGDSILTRDNLDPFEAALLMIDDVDLDTLPTMDAYRIAGSASGRAVLTGFVKEFNAAVTADILNPAYHANSASRLQGTVTMSGLPAFPPPFEIDLRADSIDAGGRTLLGAQVAGTWTDGIGSFDVSLDRSTTERYVAEGDFAIDSLGGRVDLRDLRLDLGSERWVLANGAGITWGDRGLVLEDVLLTGSDETGATGMSIRGDGAVPRFGEADLSIDITGFPLSRASMLLQLSDTVRGRTSGTIVVTGTGADPTILADLQIRELAFRQFTVDSVAGTLDYRSRIGVVDLRTSLGGRSVLSVTGSVPLDLSFGEASERIPAEAVDLIIDVDSLPVSVPMAYFRNFEDPEGTLSGRARIGGTPYDPEHQGTFTLTGGGLRIEALGVRYRGIGGTFELLPEGVIGVDLAQNQDGSASIRGQIILDPDGVGTEVIDPEFNLQISGDQFLAVSRRDLTARITGDVTLTGRYRSPSVEGAVRVVEGQLSTAELQRLADVVDPTDPEFLELAVDTTLAGGLRFVDLQPSPFLQSLRANVEIELAREFKLVSPEVDVNLEGTLAANWDRRAGDLSLRGTLTTVRGTYTTLEKVFQVQSGTVRFVGVPGIDPVLNVTAVNRVRLPDRAPLNVIAHLEGTLQNPRVRLTSDAEGGISEEDLIGYLLFGRPTYQLTQGQNAQVTGVAGSFFGAGATIGLGAVATQLGAAAIRGSPIDYFAVTQQQGTALDSDFLGATVASTLVEMGIYVEQDIFVAFQLRPLVSVGSVRQSEFAGATAELRLSDTFTLQLFYEDRFTRGRINGFGTGGVQLDKQGGLFLFKTWGY